MSSQIQFIATKYPQYSVSYCPCMIKNNFDGLSETIYPNAREDRLYKTVESADRTDAITENNLFTDWEKTLLFPLDDAAGCARISVMSDYCGLGRIFAQLYVFPFDGYYSFPIDRDTMSNVQMLLSQIFNKNYGSHRIKPLI